MLLKYLLLLLLFYLQILFFNQFKNRKIEEAKRVEAELVRVHEEADRAKYDATRESNENIRSE